MKLSVLRAAVCAAVLSLSACGGDGDGAAGGSSAAASDPATLTKNDTVVGTGAEATDGARVKVDYTGWLYSAGAAANGYKGGKFETGSFTFVVGASGTSESALPGFSQGVLGMKAGGRRTIVVPSSLAYGSTGVPGTIPANSGLVFDVELVQVCGAGAC